LAACVRQSPEGDRAAWDRRDSFRGFLGSSLDSCCTCLGCYRLLTPGGREGGHCHCGAGPCIPANRAWDRPAVDILLTEGIRDLPDSGQSWVGGDRCQEALEVGNAHRMSRVHHNRLACPCLDVRVVFRPDPVVRRCWDVEDSCCIRLGRRRRQAPLPVEGVAAGAHYRAETNREARPQQQQPPLSLAGPAARCHRMVLRRKHPSFGLNCWRKSPWNLESPGRGRAEAESRRCQRQQRRRRPRQPLRRPDWPFSWHWP